MSDFDDFNVPPDESGTPKAQRTGAGQMWLASPCRNSLESVFRAQIITEAALQTSISFVDSQGVVEHKHRSEFADDALQSPELLALRRRIFAHLQRHVSLCRSLGEGATVAQYQDACRIHGMTPLQLPNGYR
jgi:hypothetical protein